MESKIILDAEKLKQDFIILNDGKLTYLDNAATSLTPEVVIGAMNQYYGEFNANVHRSIHKIGEKATEEYEKAHAKIAKFINAEIEEIIFTRGTTESLNTLAYSLTSDLKEGDEILISEMEHHSNLVPWQQLAKERKLKLKFIKIKDNELDLNEISDKVKIISVTHVSNVLGTVNNIKKIADIAHSKNAIIIVDSAQGIPHIKVDVKELDVDFLCFSGHKMCGPTGIGVLYGKKSLLKKLKPFMYGGEMISKVDFEGSEWNELPWKFEAGTPNIAGGIGLGRAAEYLMNIGIDNIENYEKELIKYAVQELSKLNNIKIYGLDNRSGLVSFNLDGIHAHDVAAILDRFGIAVRAGHMCAMPLVTQVLKEQSVVRASFYFYNTKDDVDKLVKALRKVQEVFS